MPSAAGTGASPVAVAVGEGRGEDARAVPGDGAEGRRPRAHWAATSSSAKPARGGDRRCRRRRGRRRGARGRGRGFGACDRRGEVVRSGRTAEGRVRSRGVVEQGDWCRPKEGHGGAGGATRRFGEVLGSSLGGGGGRGGVVVDRRRGKQFLCSVGRSYCEARVAWGVAGTGYLLRRG